MKNKYRIEIGGRYSHTTKPMTEMEVVLYIAALAVKNRCAVVYQKVSD